MVVQGFGCAENYGPRKDGATNNTNDDDLIHEAFCSSGHYTQPMKGMPSM
jgi:hypothetical protein